MSKLAKSPTAKPAARKTVAGAARAGVLKRTPQKASRAHASGEAPAARPAPGPSTPKGTTVRLDPAVKAGLMLAQSLLKMTANKIINEAVKTYVSAATKNLEADLEGKLAKLRAYRMSDPSHEKAIADFANAEAAHGTNDPGEGTAVVLTGATRRRTREHA